MLPILRLISVGGVLLAITMLSLALIPPGRQHVQWAAGDVSARGALIDRLAHPEWRQFLILAALRRAGELDRLRDLPETSSVASGAVSAEIPDRAPKTAVDTNLKFAGLPMAPDEVVPEDTTGSINVAPNATMPIDIGETSSFELPVGPAEEKPPVARSPAVGMTDNAAGESVTPAIAAPDLPSAPLSKVVALASPEQAVPVVVIRKRNMRKGAVKPAAAKGAEANVTLPPPFNILQAIFASLSGRQSTTVEPPAQPAIKRRPAVTQKRTANIR